MTYASDVLPVWDHALHLIKDYGYEYRDDPFRLSSGQLSHDYIDGKRAIAAGERLRVVSDAMIEHAKQQGMAFTHVGGLTMGADLLAGGIALMADAGWFSVRKEPKWRTFANRGGVPYAPLVTYGDLGIDPVGQG